MDSEITPNYIDMSTDTFSPKDFELLEFQVKSVLMSQPSSKKQEAKVTFKNEEL